MIKRLFDIIVSALGLIILAPLLCAIAILIKFTSPGPVFYRGVRTGHKGKPFKIFKFRSMIVNAEKVGGASTAKDDPRITRIGGFLRKTKLDEIPQLLNVFKGDMSFVGPRPEVAQYTERYNEEEKIILSVRPGITDYSSIRFSSLDEVLGSQNADQVFEEKVLPIKNQLRMQYVRERSFWGDIKIILLTLGIVARKFGPRR